MAEPRSKLALGDEALALVAKMTANAARRALLERELKEIAHEGAELAWKLKETVEILSGRMVRRGDRDA